MNNDYENTKKPCGGYRKGAGRKPSPLHLKKVIYNTRLPQWLRDWLTRPDRTMSGPVAIEQALCQVFGLKPPKGIGKSEAQHQFEDVHQRGAKLAGESPAPHSRPWVRVTLSGIEQVCEYGEQLRPKLRRHERPT